MPFCPEGMQHYKKTSCEGVTPDTHYPTKSIEVIQIKYLAEGHNILTQPSIESDLPWCKKDTFTSLPTALMIML